MATERWLMLGVGAGGDRQALHEVIRRHSLAVRRGGERGAAPNDLLDRLAADPAFAACPAADAPGASWIRPATPAAPRSRSTSSSTSTSQPLLARARPLAAEAGGAEVRV